MFKQFKTQIGISGVFKGFFKLDAVRIVYSL
jgi:hypothetical protein